MSNFTAKKHNRFFYNKSKKYVWRRKPFKIKNGKKKEKIISKTSNDLLVSDSHLCTTFFNLRGFSMYIRDMSVRERLRKKQKMV